MNTPLAWKNLSHNKVRTSVGVAGVGFAVILDYFDRVYISTSGAGTVLLLETGLHRGDRALEDIVSRGLAKTS